MSTESVNEKLNAAKVNRELEFTASRSEGPGGQNVNKVNSKVTLRLDITNSQIINDDEKKVIKEKLSSFLTKEGVLMLSSQDKRSQLQNKEEVIKKLDTLLTKAFTVRKRRKPTKPSKSAKEKRIRKKKLASEKKKWRRDIY
ncbi:MAG TPA: alternative ribosome rescue aminoacyl-tRNA hydrolase ArfB [Chryseolinea sp.]|nr:alternative ribosome rescue aminoacyl-tRNA hydrolase ArfB [Chryseolinea sp.]